MLYNLKIILFISSYMGRWKQGVADRIIYGKSVKFKLIFNRIVLIKYAYLDKTNLMTTRDICSIFRVIYIHIFVTFWLIFKTKKYLIRIWVVINYWLQIKFSNHILSSQSWLIGFRNNWFFMHAIKRWRLNLIVTFDWR